MGWDAFATETIYGKDFDRDWRHDDAGSYLTDPVLAQAFEDASITARRLTDEDCVDWMLKHGGLDCSPCAEALETAIGGDVSCWSQAWGPADVQAYAARARWNGDAPLTWPQASAKAFLETCAKHGLGIRFSW